MNFDFIIQFLSWILIISGSAFVFLGSVGFYRLPDFWSRLHAASVLDSAGVLLLIAGMCLQSGFTLVTVKLILITLFLIVTGPTATHAIANAALVSSQKTKKDNSKP